MKIHNTDTPLKQCIFEHVYFSRPDSTVENGDTIDKSRRKIGKQLANEHPIDADVVIAVPDSGNTMALGYADEIRIRFEHGLIRNHYVGRTFIHPEQNGRDFKVKMKFAVVRGVLKDKIVVLVDDSIVRGTTMKSIVKLIKEQGEAKEVHVRVGSPPVVAPCYWGMDFPTEEELAWNRLSKMPVYNNENRTMDIPHINHKEQVQKFVGANSLEYLSLEGLHKSIPDGIEHVDNISSLCDCSNGSHCDVGQYQATPIDVVLECSKCAKTKVRWEKRLVNYCNHCFSKNI